MKTVYVSGPYSHPDPGENTRKAIEAGEALLNAGYRVFVPHLSHFWHQQFPKSWGEWMAIDLAWIDVCDLLVRLPGESKGADIEVERAFANGIPVYMGLDALLAPGV